MLCHVVRYNGKYITSSEVLYFADHWLLPSLIDFFQKFVLKILLYLIQKKLNFKMNVMKVNNDFSCLFNEFTP